LSDDENTTFVFRGESDGASVEQDRSDASGIDPNESSADRASWPAESPVRSARVETAEDVMAIADTEDAEDVHSLLPELGDRANTSRQNENPLQLIHEVMAVNSHRSDKEAVKLMQTKQQLEVLRDRHAQLKVKLQSTDKEINQLDREREELQANSQDNNNMSRKLEQAAELLQPAAQAREINDS
jgi:hypothetical protein